MNAILVLTIALVTIVPRPFISCEPEGQTTTDIWTPNFDSRPISSRLDLAKRKGYRYTERVSLKAGVYQARIGVLEIATERIGTATGWIEVPDLEKGRLTLSTLMMSRSSAATQAPARNDAAVESLSPLKSPGVKKPIQRVASFGVEP